MNGIVIENSFSEQGPMLEARRLLPELRPGDAIFLISCINGAVNRRLDIKFPGGVAAKVGVSVEVLQKIIQTLCTVELIAKDGNFLWSPYIEDKVKAISNRNRDNALASGRKASPAAVSDASSPIYSDPIKSDPKEGESKGGTQIDQFPPCPLEVRKNIEMWGQYLLKNHRKSFDFMARDALLMRFMGRHKELIEDINYSIENGWKSIQTRPKAPIPKSGSGPYPNQINPEISRRVVPNATATKALMDKVFAEASKKPLVVTK